MTTRKIAGIILAGIVLFQFFETSAQSYAESAHTFTMTRSSGSARILGIGGAQTSLGGDFSSALSNPAGLGMYNRSEISLSLGQSFFSSNAYFQGTKNDDFGSRFNLPGFSLVINTAKGDDGFVSATFALTYSRTNDFNNNTFYSGLNTQSSMANFFVEDAAGAFDSQFSQNGFNYNSVTRLAFENYIIGDSSILDPSYPADMYFSDILLNGSDPVQSEQITTRGHSGQWNVSYGANFDDRFFLGAGLGIANIRYRSKKLYSEEFNDPYINSFDLAENLEIRGTGINVTLGIIARPVQFLQVGFSYSSPTLYQVTERYSASMSSSWNNFDYYNSGNPEEFLNDEYDETDILQDEYSLTTPHRLRLGATFITKMGFISTDIEMVNPSRARYSSEFADVSYSNENSEISATYKGSINLRLGGELRLGHFRARAGVGLLSNSFDESVGLKNNTTTGSIGFGYRSKVYFIDFALVRTFSKGRVYNPYVLSSNSPRVEIDNNFTTGMITLGRSF